MPCAVPLDRGPGLGREVGRNRMARSARSRSQWKPLMRSAGDGEAIQAWDRRLQSWARGSIRGKERGQPELRSSRPLPPGCGRVGCGAGGLGPGQLLPPALPPPPHLFPLLPTPSCLSLVQVRSSLGTNILSAMAAFAGTAILLMDFGVTSWVCRRVPPAVGTHGGPQMQTQGLGQARVRSTRGPGPWALAGPAGLNRPHQYTDLY